ncbi:hypothetical protein JY446_23765 [Serratia marcescens]|uniref:hypothetical protein n=1 Tax=Serratia TaxID=613 RepID=UPI00100907C5|nr:MULTISPECIES: hypothetical protein [Serratia]MBN5232356.1 hypothetical protein [Serratia marcescens]MDX6804205.1 hypothetical protein [Serratia marcescens]MDX6909062.1 hypothetical protein [Serratia marcescens]WGZ65450.1 hypothetical protein SSARUM_004822 [Serratia sp. K-M0706]WRV63624.1 hypothetical protein VOT19_24120 [Serratia sp. K-M0228]
MSEHMSPLDQLYILNAELMKHGDKFTSPIVTVGGQAVHYWVVWYKDIYSEHPPIDYITSNDIDVTARNIDISVISSVLDVPVNYNDGSPPSLAILPLKNIKDGKIKTYFHKKFVNKEIFDDRHIEEPNIVDVLSSASYLTPSDFNGRKLIINTEVFHLPMEKFQYTAHDKVRVLNPITCMASRFHNVTQGVKRNVVQEVARIKALMVPVVAFIIEKFFIEEFRNGRKFLDLFVREVGKTAYRRFIVEHQIDIIKMLELIHSELSESGEFEENNHAFLTKELPNTIHQLSLQIERKKAQIHREILTKNKQLQRG